MRFFKPKIGLDIQSYVTAIDGNVVARKGEKVDASFLNRLESIRPSDVGDLEPIKNSRLYSDLEFMLHHEKYSFISANGKFKNSILDIISSLQISRIVMKELTWMRKYPYQYHHSLAIALIATRMILDFCRATIEAKQAVLSGLTHDFGITRVPEEILNKVSPLEGDELSILQEHPTYSYVLLVYYGFSIQDPVSQVGYCHHENLRGTGYPRGIIQENAISKCIQIVDIYDALTTARPFRPAMAPDKAIETIADQVDKGELDSDAFALLRSYIDYPN